MSEIHKLKYVRESCDNCNFKKVEIKFDGIEGKEPATTTKRIYCDKFNHDFVRTISFNVGFQSHRFFMPPVPIVKRLYDENEIICESYEMKDPIYGK